MKSASDHAQVHIASVAETSPRNLAKIVAEIIDEKLKLLKVPFGKSQVHQSQTRGPGGHRNAERQRISIVQDKIKSPL